MAGISKQVRRAALAVAMLASCAGAGVVSAPAAGAAAPVCDEILIAGSAWLDGQGVDVRSNGQYTGSSGNCREPVMNLQQNPPQWGYGWQCPELINRLYLTRGWMSESWNGSGSGAASMYGPAPADLAKDPQGSVTRLRPGDAVIYSTAFTPGTGHIDAVGTWDPALGKGEVYGENAGPVNSPITLVGGTITARGATGDKIVGVVHRPTSSTRVFGADRIATAIAASGDRFAAQGAGAVVLARSDGFADALAGTPLAVAEHGPILLTGTSALDQRTLSEIQRVLPAGGEVHLLGGPAALGSAVESSLAGAGFKVTRYAGAERYDTAVLVAEALPAVTQILLVTGANFPDGLAAGAAAAKVGGAVLLTNGATMPSSTASSIAANPGVPVTAIGGPAAAAAPSATGVLGVDRYATALEVAKKFFPAAVENAGLASGVNFPDALSGGAHIGALGGPLLLTDPAALPSGLADYTRTKVMTRVYIFGGPSAIGSLLDRGL